MVNRLNLPVILVIGLRLGCINHALLTARAIEEDGAELDGWITSQLDPDYASLKETMFALQARINAPLLGKLPYMEKFDLEKAASRILVRDRQG